MAEALAITLHAMGEETADGQSTPVDIGTRRSAARLRLEVLAATTALSVVVQTSNSAAGPWRDAGVFPTFSTPGQREIGVGKLLQFVRASWTTSASVTFAILGEAHTLYANPSQIECAPGVLEGVADSDKVLACIAASGEAEGYIASAYTMPITAWSTEVVRKTGLIAAWNVIFRRGIRPDGADEVVMLERDKAIGWFKQIRSGSLRPPGIIDSTPDTYEGGGYVVNSSPRRGW